MRSAKRWFREACGLTAAVGAAAVEAAATEAAAVEVMVQYWALALVRALEPSLKIKPRDRNRDVAISVVAFA